MGKGALVLKRWLCYRIRGKPMPRMGMDRLVTRRWRYLWHVLFPWASRWQPLPRTVGPDLQSLAWQLYRWGTLTVRGIAFERYHEIKNALYQASFPWRVQIQDLHIVGNTNVNVLDLTFTLGEPWPEVPWDG